MSVKKLLILAAAGVVSTAAFAGGASGFSMNNSHTMSSASNSGFMPKAYVDARVGVDMTGLENSYAAKTAGTKFKSMSGNPLTFAGDVGYMFRKHWGVELGGAYVMKNEVKATKGTLNVYDIYAAAKLSDTVMPAVSVYMKGGVDYLSVKTSKNISTKNGTATQVAPTLGAGVDFSLNQWAKGLYASVDYRHDFAMTANTPVKKIGMTVPGQDFITVGVGYMFNVAG